MNRDRVLFVDDEPNILRSLKREFLDAPFETLTANSAAQGLELMEKESVDLVVSDVKMPEMDGIQFLELVKKRFPKVNRVILSGYVEQTAVVSSIIKGIASTYFAKPWDSTDLRHNIEQILHIKTLLGHPTLQTALNSINRLPTLPGVYQDFISAIEQDCSTKALAQILSKDIALTTRILQVANSIFYSAQRIASVERALIQLGTNIVKDIALTVSVSTQMNWSPVQKRQLEEIFTHSARVSRLTSDFYRAVYNKSIEESSNSVALTHDIGKIILLQFFPETYQTIHQAMAKDETLTFYQAELSHSNLGVTHSEIGAYFLSWWNLPGVNVSAALYHHRPSELRGREADLIHILSIANLRSNLSPLISSSNWLALTEESPFGPEERNLFWTISEELT